jgi:phosphoribosylformimino-5-aminoimidazole carboxamide ribonucleotide (ProFAR) isomerase
MNCYHVNYVGNSYESTEDIEIYYAKSDIKKEFTIIGHAISAGQVFVSVEKLEEELINEAKSNGADAIIITDINRDNEYDGRGYDAEKQIKATFVKFKQ